MKTYVVGAEGAYRLGRLYAQGENISIPEEEQPSRTWLEEDGKPVKVAPKSAASVGDLTDDEKAFIAELRADKAKAAPKVEVKPAPAPAAPVKPGRASDKDAI